MLGYLTGLLRRQSATTLATLVLVWVFVLHASSLYLFTRGFLLTRLALQARMLCDRECTLPPTHSKAVFLVIDALRFDFISPDPPVPSDPFHHGVLTLPAELTASQPDRSFIFNAYSDPPTATLQRIKGITTGSLPTFVEIGSNFGGSEIKEDSLIQQLNASGKRIAFMGDDTWMTVYQPLFSPDMAWPYDSFNVEDLHTVDEGVIRHLFPLLKEECPSWDFIVGHFLGVDHAGHRVGPSGFAMKAKLEQMDSILREVVENLDDDTLLVVLGDHGMDRKGDHGGDGIHETSSATWIYSKSIPLSNLAFSDFLPAEQATAEVQKLPTTTFPGSTVGHRAIQQIDLVPSISLLLGLPIPFNNLGMIIPELFMRYALNAPEAGDEETSPGWLPSFNRRKQESGELLLTKSLRLNAEQIHAYLEEYRSSPAGGELDKVWDQLQEAYDSLPDGLHSSTDPTEWDSLRSFIRTTLQECRALWAQFNMILMCTGLAALLLSVPASWLAYRLLDRPGAWKDAAVDYIAKGVVGGVAGLVISVALYPATSLVTRAFDVTQVGLVGLTFGSSLILLGTQMKGSISLLSNLSFSRTILPLIVLALHGISYTSNSFLMWEDRVVQYFILTFLFASFITSATAPEQRLRQRIFGFTLASAVLLRMITISTVCREEQHPYCHVTFYASSTTPVAPALIALGAPLLAYFLSYAVQFFLSMSKSDKGVAPLFLHRLWTWALVGGSAYWLLERLENWEGLQPARVPLVQTIRTILARVTMGGSLFACGTVWWYSPPCVEMERQTVGEGAQKKTTISILGFANAYGSSYLLFTLIPFAVFFATAQPTGQVVLALSLIVVLSYAEITDSQNDAAGLFQAFTNINTVTDLDNVKAVPQKPTFVVPAFLSLLSLSLFYATGHQAVMSTIQWKSAFIGFPTLTYPFAPILVALNTFGPMVLPALAAPLFALWNVDPAPLAEVMSGSSPTEDRIVSNALKISLGVALYHGTLTLGTAISAAILRRHLMVWKVFAPRFMLGGLSLLVVDLALILAMAIGVTKVAGKVRVLQKALGAKMQ